MVDLAPGSSRFRRSVGRATLGRPEYRLAGSRGATRDRPLRSARGRYGSSAAPGDAATAVAAAARPTRSRRRGLEARPRPQPLGGLLGRQVALGLGEQLVADHELADVRAQERRVEVAVDLPAVDRRRRRRTAPGASPSSTGTAGGTARRTCRAARRATPPASRARSGRGRAGARPADAGSRASRTARPPRTARPRATRRSRPPPAGRPIPARRSRAAAAARCGRGGRAWFCVSRTASTGSAVPAQTWPCGCGFEAPIAAPRFSKTWTQR